VGAVQLLSDTECSLVLPQPVDQVKMNIAFTFAHSGMLLNIPQSLTPLLFSDLKMKLDVTNSTLWNRCQRALRRH
jgi:hypothetical protein